MPELELYGTASCQFTAELREDLLWKGIEFEEFDVEVDAAARQRFLKLTAGGRAVPVLVSSGKVVSIGWQGRSCFLGSAPNP